MIKIRQEDALKSFAAQYKDQGRTQNGVNYFPAAMG